MVSFLVSRCASGRTVGASERAFALVSRLRLVGRNCVASSRLRLVGRTFGPSEPQAELASSRNCVASSRLR